MAIEIEFIALRVVDGSAVRSTVLIDDPVRLAWASHGYQARVAISGFLDFDKLAYGGSALQALEYAVLFVRMELLLQSAVWRYEGPDGNPIDLIYPQIEMPA